MNSTFAKSSFVWRGAKWPKNTLSHRKESLRQNKAERNLISLGSYRKSVLKQMRIFDPMTTYVQRTSDSVENCTFVPRSVRILLII